MTGNTPFPGRHQAPGHLGGSSDHAVSRRTVYRLMHVGGLEAIKVSRFSRIPEHAVKPQVRQ